jgi:hypothetical protein
MGVCNEYWPWAPFDRVEAGASLGLVFILADQLFTLKSVPIVSMANITYEMNFIKVNI